MIQHTFTNCACLFCLFAVVCRFSARYVYQEKLINYLYLIVIVALLALALVTAASITCYSGNSYSGYSIVTADVCYTYTNVYTYKTYLGTGSGSYNCSSTNVWSSLSGYSCCITNLCNGAKIHEVSILMASVAAMVALFRAMWSIKMMRRSSSLHREL